MSYYDDGVDYEGLRVRDAALEAIEDKGTLPRACLRSHLRAAAGTTKQGRGY